MRPKVIASGVGTILMVIPIFLLLPFIVGLLFEEDPVLMAFTYLLPALFSLLLGFTLRYPGLKELREIRPGESLVVVAIAWLAIGVLGALPFHIIGTLPSFIDCVFESISGFTTTGSSVIVEIDGLPGSILFWRSLIQWVGGMGFIVLMVAVLSFFIGGPKAGLALMKGEIPGRSIGKIIPRIKDVARSVIFVYVILTVLGFFLLLSLGMTGFDAICHVFTALATGGYSTHTASIAYYSDRPNGFLIEMAIVFLMLLGSTSFLLHYNLMRRKVFSYHKDIEFRYYIIIWSSVILMITLDLFINGNHGLIEAFRDSAFQTTSLISTTGYATADYDGWPELSRYLLILIMFMGGMTGSTSGAMKVARIIIARNIIVRTITHLRHPHSVIPIRVGGVVISEEVVRKISLFIFAYISIFFIASFIMTIIGLDAISAMSSVITTMGGVGPGLASVGPMMNFAHVSSGGKIILCILMWLGRLELLPVLYLLLPSSWR